MSGRTPQKRRHLSSRPAVARSLANGIPPLRCGGVALRQKIRAQLSLRPKSVRPSTGGLGGWWVGRNSTLSLLSQCAAAASVPAGFAFHVGWNGAMPQNLLARGGEFAYF